MAELDPRIAAITDRIIERSKLGRRRYLDLNVLVHCVSHAGAKDMQERMPRL
ncbi:MAG: hypothetical protein ABIP07_05800 [Sphingomicrobium sp.]